MEFKDIQPFVIMVVLVGMVIGVGVLTFEKTSQSVFNTVNIVNESVNWSTGHPVNITMAHGNWTTMSFTNASGTAVATSNFTSFASVGIIQAESVGVCENNASCLATYSYKEYDTPTATALAAATTEVSGISTNWLGLIVTVMILSILLAIVIRSFTMNR